MQNIKYTAFTVVKIQYLLPLLTDFLSKKYHFSTIFKISLKSDIFAQKTGEQR